MSQRLECSGLLHFTGLQLWRCSDICDTGCAHHTLELHIHPAWTAYAHALLQYLAYSTKPLIKYYHIQHFDLFHPIN